MPLVYGCITPHGGEIIPALAGKKLDLFAPTRSGMRRVAKMMEAARPDTIIVASPHNLRMLRHIGVVISERSSGWMASGSREVHLRAECDVDLGMKVIETSEERGLPVAGVNYGALQGPLSDLAMDWGTFVPFWFFSRRKKAKILIVTPSRGIPLSQNFEFGRVVAKVAENEPKRVAFVASADQAHAHKKNGPYGYDRRAAEYDRLVVEAIRTGKLESIMEMSPGFVSAASPDSFWQMTMLAGVSSVVPMRSELFSYQVPTYYGMICAGFVRS